MRPSRVAVLALGAVATFGCSSANYASSSPSASPASTAQVMDCEGGGGVWRAQPPACVYRARNLTVDAP